LIQIADPDTSSKTAKQEIKMHTKANPYHVHFGSASNFETILTLQQVDSPTGTTELKFETLFANAKDALARQTKARFYLTKNELLGLRDNLDCLLNEIEKQLGGQP
jgi:hypothetical protein